MAHKDHEKRIRLLVGRSHFADRAVTVWTRLTDGKRPRRCHRYTENHPEEITFPLRPRQVIIADSSVTTRPPVFSGEVYAIRNGPTGWTVNEIMIGLGRGHVPGAIASREVYFDIVKR